MGLFDWLKNKKRKKAPNIDAEKLSREVYPEGWSRENILKLAQRNYETLNDSIKLLGMTVAPGTFFSRYEIAVREAKYLEKLCPWDEIGRHAGHLALFLEVNKIEIINDFLDRCDAAKKLHFLKEEMTQHRDAMPKECYAYFCQLLGQCNKSSDQREYIYCSVVFKEQGKSYYYLCNRKNIRPGDQVMVPVGKNNEATTAQVVKVEVFQGNNAPVPVGHLKWIL